MTSQSQRSSAMMPGKHWYSYVLSRKCCRITTNVYTDRTLTGEELLPLAIEIAIVHARALGEIALPDEYAPVGYKYRGTL
ncbi:hypothetical protein [Paenibacillus sp. FSL L8-0708]|uniref:hypothetical protein n=1 Tax=Paenibacillus sp. FSL L8-0708 TaxID=2975311 RepID=UPI0030F7415C